MQYIMPISIVICTKVHYYDSAEVIPLVKFWSVMPVSLLQALLIKRVFFFFFIINRKFKTLQSHVIGGCLPTAQVLQLDVHVISLQKI